MSYVLFFIIIINVLELFDYSLCDTILFFKRNVFLNGDLNRNNNRASSAQNI